ncbi:uncharacterized protein VP01_507g9 [Puccinia sorghi]|uniref:Uncharacterized protein n=1 Tax=Puccinia sorghi TaxID=27349 RepID=A0A0L6ULE3_9BASI|nr:uncharacterized protein VP01_507g9 [Puccinia sorghi]
MPSSIASYLELLEGQVDQVRTSHTPGPLSIAIFFLGFILINQSIRMLLSSEEPAEDESELNMSNGASSSRGLESRMMEAQVAKAQDEEEEEEDDEDEEGLTDSQDMMRMMLLKNTFAECQRPRTSSNRPTTHTMMTSSMVLPDPLSASFPIVTSISSASDSHIHQHFPSASHPHSQATHHFQDLSDSCSASTTSA